MNEYKIEITTQSAFNIIIITQSVLLLVASLLIYRYNIVIKPLFQFNVIQALIGLGLGILIAFITKFTILLNLNSKLEVFVKLKELYLGPVYQLFTNFSISQILIISITSGFCEEILYRSVLQNLIGFLPTNLIFGVMHTPKLSIWPLLIFSIIVGIILSCLKIYCHSLWPSIICHTINNLISLLLLKYYPIKK